MSETKIYTFAFDEKKNLFRLVPETGRVMRVKSDHKKFEWLKKQEAGKVVKINASGRWTASKDYDGLYGRLQEQVDAPATPTETAPKPTPAPKRKPKAKAAPTPPVEPTRPKSVFGHHHVWLGIQVIASRYQKVSDIHIDVYDDLMLDVATFCTTTSSVSTQDLIQKFKIGYNRAQRIFDTLDKLSIIKDGTSLVRDERELSKFFAMGSDRVDLSVDPKSDVWPILEEVPCPTCDGAGKLVSFKTVASGFLNLMKKQVRVEEVCHHCGGLSHTETLHYPYHFQGPAERAYKVDVTLDLDPVAAEILEELMVQDEFSKRELLQALKRSKTVKVTAEDAFQDCWSLKEGTPTGIGEVPPLATWRMVQEVKPSLNTYASFQVGDTEPYIKPFFKAGIIDHGTKRRSTKDTETYYKFTKDAKAFYKTL